uniref:Poly(A) polymerase central domain-containing protein n=1 Tax=Meloidogyne javanica TaxID=6303 RepID=A0A915LD00_MELJA
MDEALNNAMNNNNSIYGNQFGFLSGTSMLIMLTKIYLLYPNTCSVLVIIDRFFLTFLTCNSLIFKHFKRMVYFLGSLTLTGVDINVIQIYMDFVGDALIHLIKI